MDQRIFVAKVGDNGHLKEVQQIDTNKIHRYHKLGYKRVDDQKAKAWLAKQAKKREAASTTETESTQTQTT